MELKGRMIGVDRRSESECAFIALTDILNSWILPLTRTLKNDMKDN
jgi:hypothetical protein